MNQINILNDITTAIIVICLTSLVIVLALNSYESDAHNKLLESPIDVYFKTYTTN